MSNPEHGQVLEGGGSRSVCVCSAILTMSFVKHVVEVHIQQCILTPPDTLRVEATLASGHMLVTHTRRHTHTKTKKKNVRHANH